MKHLRAILNNRGLILIKEKIKWGKDKLLRSPDNLVFARRYAVTGDQFV